MGQPANPDQIETDWMTGFASDDWRQIVSSEHPGYLPNSVAYEQRRAFRLYAQAPLH